MKNREQTKKFLKIGLYSIAVLIIVGYAFFAFNNLLRGPSVVIDEPQNGSTFATSTVLIRGTAERIQDISLDGRSLTIDDKGNFAENMLLAPGYNIFTLEAKDKFGRSKEYRLELIYKVN